MRRGRRVHQPVTSACELGNVDTFPGNRPHFRRPGFPNSSGNFNFVPALGARKARWKQAEARSQPRPGPPSRRRHGAEGAARLCHCGDFGCSAEAQAVDCSGSHRSKDLGPICVGARDMRRHCQDRNSGWHHGLMTQNWFVLTVETRGRPLRCCPVRTKLALLAKAERRGPRGPRRRLPLFLPLGPQRAEGCTQERAWPGEGKDEAAGLCKDQHTFGWQTCQILT